MSTPVPLPIPIDDLTGICYISQLDSYLTRYKDRAVTMDKKTGGQFIWKVTALDPSDPSSPLTFALLPPQNEPDVKDPLFTLGVLIKPEVEIPIFVEPPMTGAGKRQYWTLSHVRVTKRLPLLFTAKIDSCSDPDLMAATGQFNEQIPNPFRNVDAVLKEGPAENTTWTFDYRVEKE